MSLHPLLPLPLLALLVLPALALAGGRLVADPARRPAWARRAAAAAAVALALLGPTVAGGQATQRVSEVDVWFVVDTTTSANARDHAGERPRLEGYREDVAQIAERLPGARFSLITFDATSRVVLPLTTDTTALATAMETLVPQSSSGSSGSSITAGAPTLEASLARAGEARPERSRLVFYLGDGEQTSGEQPAPFAVGDRVTGGAVLGYGTAEGGPMAEIGPGGRTGADITDSTGAPGRSVIDEDALGEIADQLGVPYVHRDGGDIGPALVDADPGRLTGEGRATVADGRSLAWPLALLALGLLCLDLWRLSTEAARLRQESR